MKPYAEKAEQRTHLVVTASKVLMGVIDINDIVDVVNCPSPWFCVILDGTVGGLFLAGA